ncbi:phosphoesterase [Acidianus sulfidivorans JP7]|uniref:metallophosphoesterase family protein n=1 Tax=Acidianus sulfidivorans TaxID=312539 RepID=UPI001443306A|nr:metallophosphoesterase [Acidianus sulfidivorans]AWR96822.2 phosphoesterase [Acidianus sulfidivorans JP7]
MGLQTKIMFVTDVHGSEVVFRKALNGSKMFSINYLIFGGDMFSKDFVLVLKRGNAFLVDDKDVSLEELEENYKTKGVAPLFFEKKDEIDEFINNPHFRKEKILDFVKGQADAWIKIFEEKMNNSNVKVIWNLGNDDPIELDDYLKERGFEISEDKIVELNNDYILVSCGYVNPTPWNTYRELPDSTLYNKIKDKLKKIENPENVIFNFHAPPINTKLDVAIINNKRIHVGSESVRKIIEEYQPLLGLHGHIHESAGTDKIGNTKIVNPGSSYSDGILNYSVILLEKNSKGFGKIFMKKSEVKGISLGRG